MEIKSVLSRTLGAEVLGVPFRGQLVLERLIDAKTGAPRYLPMRLTRPNAPGWTGPDASEFRA